MIEGKPVSQTGTITNEKKVSTAPVKAVVDNTASPLSQNDKSFMAFQRGVPASRFDFDNNEFIQVPYLANRDFGVKEYTLISEEEKKIFTEVKVSDAVKINRDFDLAPKVNMKNLSQNFDKWASKVADTLYENNTEIIIGKADGTKYRITPDVLKNMSDSFAKNKVEGYKEIKSFFKDKIGVAFFNTLMAVDDITNNLKTDPYYQDVIKNKKYFDLSSENKSYHIDNDKVGYTANLKSHEHRNISLIIESKIGVEAPSLKKEEVETAVQVIKRLARNVDSDGDIKDKEKFDQDMYAVLDNQDLRKNLVEHFKINSKENLNNLIPAIVSEAGLAAKQIDYNAYLSVGSVMINRTLGRNLKKAVRSVAMDVPVEKIKPITVRDILMEEGQFAVTWENLPGMEKTILDYQKGIYNLFKSDKLKKEGGNYLGFSLATEVSKDILAGTTRLSSEINGTTEKNTGRKISDLFFFNQSHNEDYSHDGDASVKLVDKNNTQVFFKTWNGTPYF